MVQVPLRTGEHRVVVRSRGDRGTGHSGDTTDETVARCVGDEIVEAATLTLGRDGERSELTEGAGVHEVGDVLACGALASLMTTLDGFGAGIVGGDMTASSILREVLAFFRSGGRLVGLRDDGRTRSDAKKDLTFLHGVAHGDGNVLDHTVCSCRDRIFHLHRLDDHDLVTFSHGVAG